MVLLRKKQCIAMLLAGGQGSRLGILTKVMAKPAVPFGGKYRIIDFPLSNCSHSGIDTVGVLTQYQPLELNSYIGSGQPWDLDLNSGGVFVLPPYQKLSGDHIYKMDYNKMVRFHARSNADATIAVFDVPIEEASRFGIMSTDENNQITRFEEKPPHPTSTKASMGVYVFTWAVLRDYLISDEADPTSKNDFGKNIIPRMLNDGRKMMAYGFEGYWKDVGTIESLWEANMDLLKNPPAFDLYDDKWRIYARNPVQPPHFIEDTAHVSDSMITEGCDVAGDVSRSILFAGVRVEPGAVIRDSVIMPGAVIKGGAVVTRAIVGEDSVVSAGCVVGKEACEGEDNLIALVGQHTELPENFVVKPGDQVDSDMLRLERSLNV